ncbi:MAG: hypothetical protein P1U75_16875, partial [Antarcticimicrobium sp.]|uniref:calcium-binding protein n=1 Tax=Antarcticimicrobium sp. TaxID=2824147 RepID=UPI00261FA48B
DDEIGDQVFVRVTYTDGAGREQVVESPLSATVVNTNDAPTGSVTISGTAAEGARLTADASGLSDEDGLRKFSYTWLADGTPISGATSSTLTLTQALVGARISVSVAYTDRFGTAESVTSGDTFAVSNVNDAPTGAVLIEGTKEQGQTLAVNTSGLADADGLGSFSYNWQRDGEDISGATASTYELVQADVGSVISVSVSYTDGFGTDEEATSSPTKKIIGELILTGNGGSNRLVGGKFDDTLNGRNGNDVLKGRAGDDDLVGGKGADKLLGGSGVDKLKGDAGSDILNGGSGADNLIGGGKNDDLYGGGGNDELSGSGGRDFLKGQKGDDTLTGGKGADTFFFKKGDGQDVITDFTVGADVIEIGKGANRIRQLDFEQVDEDVLVSFRNVEILVENILIEDLKDADNFLF